MPINHQVVTPDDLTSFIEGSEIGIYIVYIKVDFQMTLKNDIQTQIKGYQVVASDDLDNFYGNHFPSISLSWRVIQAFHIFGTPHLIKL